MKKLLTILSLCLLANSCSFNNQQVQNSQAVLPSLEKVSEIVEKASSTEKTLKQVSKAVKTQVKNIITTSPVPSPAQTFSGSLGGQASTAETLPSSLVNMKIITPEGESNFSVKLISGQNACDNLYEAKAEGKIKSLTIKDTYLESMGSLYVYEINGYKNNWILSSNAKSSSVGCSKVLPKAGDVVEWKFN